MADTAAGGGDRSRPRRRTAARPAVDPLDGEVDRPRSAVRMTGNEPLVGFVVAVVLALIAVIFLTVTPAKGQIQPKAAGPEIALALSVILAASMLLKHRIVSGVLAVLTSFAVQTPHVAHSVEYLRKTALLVAVAYAVWMTFHQAATQREIKIRNTAEHRLGRSVPMRPAPPRRPKKG